MKIFITNDTIRVLSFIVTSIIVITLNILYLRIIFKRYAIKIRKANEEGDKEKALDLLRFVMKKQPLAKNFYKATKNYLDGYIEDEE